MRSEIDRNGESIFGAIQSALALPPSAWPVLAKERKPEPESNGLVELLQAIVKARALQEEIAPTLLATTGDLQELVDPKTNRSALDLPLLKGWRRILVGELLLDALDGKVAFTVDPQHYGRFGGRPPNRIPPPERSRQPVCSAQIPQLNGCEEK